MEVILFLIACMLKIILWSQRELFCDYLRHWLITWVQMQVHNYEARDTDISNSNKEFEYKQDEQ